MIFCNRFGGGAIFEGVIYGGIGWFQTDAKLDSDKFDDSRRTKPAGLVESSQGVGAPLQTPGQLRRKNVAGLRPKPRLGRLNGIPGAYSLF